MSIKSETAKTKEYLRRSRNAIIGRGGEISTTAGLMDLPEAITNIPNDLSLAYYIDNDLAYRKTVPAGTCKYAYINSIGGMTFKGFTFDCVVEEFNGEYSAPYSFTFPKAFDFPTDDLYAFAPIVCGRTDAPIGDASGIHYTLSGTTMTGQGTIFNADIPAGTQLRCIPRFENQETGEYWFPPDCYTDLRDAKPTEVVSYGNNLLDFDAALAFWGMSYTKDGGKYTTPSPMSNGVGRYYKFLEEPQICTISCDDFTQTGYTYAAINIGYLDESGAFESLGLLKSGGVRSVTPTKKVNAARTYYGDGTSDPSLVTITNLRINLGTTALPYSPYREPITYTLPTGITQYLGKGCSDTLYDEYSFVDKKAITRVGSGEINSVSFDNGFNSYRTTFKASGVVASGITQAYDSSQITYINMPYFTSGVSIKQINANATWYDVATIYSKFIYLYPYRWTFDTDANKFNEWLARYPLPYVAELENYIEETINTDFNPLIEVEAGGYLEFVNDYGYPVPSTITYAIEV